MKLTKALAINVALVMVLLCFGAPAVFSADEHPWDQEGGDNGIGGTGIDSTGIRPTSNVGYNPAGKDALNQIDYFLVIVRYSIESGYYAVSQKFTKKGVGKIEKNKMTCVNSR